MEARKFRGFCPVFRRPFELLFSVLLLVTLSPLIGLTAASIALTSGRPVLFRQERIGKDRISFQLFKFRTMQVGAHDLHGELMSAQLNQRSSFLVKVKSEPRATPIGRVLRRFHVDELPQLLNVLRGEMSLVGSRPMLPEELPFLPLESVGRFDVLPGISGLAQINGSGFLPPERYLQLDRELAEKSGDFRAYLKVLLLTPLAAVRGRG